MNAAPPITWDFPYPSQRMPLLARQVLATSQPLAAQAGLAMLARGGNAVDAALAAAVALTVVEPTSNGIGGDLFAIIWDGQQLHGLNASGAAPAAWRAERFRGLAEMPLRGWDAVTVPGAVDGWMQLHQRWARLPIEVIFQPAIDHAREGYLVSPRTARAWQADGPKLARFPGFARAFMPGGRVPGAGELFRIPEMAQTLEQIMAGHGESFYRGDLAQRICRQATAEGGALSLDDLAAHRSLWVEPLSQRYRGIDIQELPPNGQGLAALIALGVLEHFDLAPLGPDSPQSIHLQIEAMKIGFTEAFWHVADPGALPCDPATLLDPQRLARWAGQIDPDAAGSPRPMRGRHEGTVYLATADAGGMMVSLIQSNFHGFGSGIVIEGTGISMHNRGSGFSLEPGHPNEVGGGKRPFHTIIPGFATAGGRPLMCLGVMGGHMQPQGHVQMVTRIVDHHHNPQAALDAPRWHVLADWTVALEPGWPPSLRHDLTRRGHRLLDAGLTPLGGYGGGQIIYRLSDGYCAGSDGRKDGQAVGW